MKRILMMTFLAVVAVFTTAVYHRVHSEWVMFRKGQAHFSRQEFAEALVLYQASAERGLHTRALWKHLGTCYLATGDPLKARAAFRKMVAQSEHRTAAEEELAGIYVRFDRFHEAEALYRIILRKNPEDRSARIRLARVLSWTGRLTAAIREYKRALGEKP